MECDYVNATQSIDCFVFFFKFFFPFPSSSLCCILYTKWVSFFPFWKYWSTLFHCCIATDDLTFDFGKGQKKSFYSEQFNKYSFGKNVLLASLKGKSYFIKKGCVVCVKGLSDKTSMSYHRWQAPPAKQSEELVGSIIV